MKTVEKEEKEEKKEEKKEEDKSHPELPQNSSNAPSAPEGEKTAEVKKEDPKKEEPKKEEPKKEEMAKPLVCTDSCPSPPFHIIFLNFNCSGWAANRSRVIRLQPSRAHSQGVLLFQSQ